MKSVLSLSLLGGLSVLSSSATAAILSTPVQTVIFEDLSGGTYTETGSFSGGSNDFNLLGFTKFDASLGTLKEIKFTMEVYGTYTLELEVSGYAFDGPNYGDTFDAYFDGFFSIINPVVIYDPSNSVFGYTAVGDVYGFSSLGGFGYSVDDYLNFDGEGDFFYFSDSLSNSFGGQVIEGSILSTDSFFNEPDFVGGPADPLTGLIAFLYFEFDGNDFSFDGLSDLSTYISIDANLNGGAVTLQYVYDDAIGVIPEPSSIAGLIAVLSFIGIAGRRRR